jgi:antirestriction protein ArdC
MSRRTSFDLYQSVTDQVIEAIESSQAEGYELPWHRSGADVFRPRNAVTGEPYHGINVVSFWAAAEISRFTSGTWATYKQWQSIGAQVQKGESSTVGVFFKQYQPTDEETGEGEKSEETEGEAESRTRWFARAFRVFNADQVDGYEAEELPEESLVERVGRADRFAQATGAEIQHGGGRAFYSPANDAIQMPEEVRFRDTGSSTATEGYYSTLFHELTHWTGPESRCDRDLTGRFGDASYAMEELVAELGAAFLCAELAISPQPRPDHAGYIAHWMEVMKADKRAIFTAAARANEAVGLLRGQ